MKKLILTIALLLMPLATMAQLTVPQGGTGTTTFQAGTLLFGLSTLRLKSDSNLFWNNTLKRLGIGTTTPQHSLHVASGTVAFQGPVFATTTIGSDLFYFQFEKKTLGGLFTIPYMRGAGSLGNIMGIADQTYLVGETVDPVLGFIHHDTLNSVGLTYNMTDDRLDIAGGSGGYTFTDGNVGIGALSNPATQLELAAGNGITLNGSLGPAWNLKNDGGTFKTNAAVAAGSAFYIGSDDLGNYSTYSPNTGVWDFQGGLNATNTSDAGWDISGGCYAIAGVCNGNGDITGDGTSGQVTFWNGPKSIYSSVADFTYSDTYAQLGVGTSTFADQTVRLALDGGSNSNQIQLYVNSTGLANQFSFNRGGSNVSYVGPSASDVWDFYTTESIPIVFTNGSSERMRITNGGLVGIGTTSPATKLHVTSGASATTTVTVGSLGLTTSKGCVNMNSVDGGAASFYINAAENAIVVEANYCR